MEARLSFVTLGVDHRFMAQRRGPIPWAAEPSSRPAMLMPPGLPHCPGCTPRHAVHGSALDHDDSLGLRRRTVGPSTAGAVPP